MAAKWRQHRQNRLDGLARKIEAITGSDRQLVEESRIADTLRADGAAALYAVCREFVDGLNGRLSAPALRLDPPEWGAESYHASGPNLLQVSLRGRLLQLEFESTEEPFSTEDFRRRYVLRGDVRSFNQDFLEQNTVDEQQIFYCPDEAGAKWHFFDVRTYRTGPLTVDYLASELERLL